MTIIWALDIVAASTVLAYAFTAVNRLSLRTWHANPVFAASAVAMTVGAAAVVIAPITGSRVPDWPEVIMHIGIAIWVIADRRRLTRRG